MKARIALLPGDGIGPEVTAAARRVLEQVASSGGHVFEFETAAIGGEAIDRFGSPLPEETLDACSRADAMLLGAVGGPRWSDPSAPKNLRPEAGLLKLRRTFDLFANLRPVKVLPALRDATPLRPELIDGVDLLIVRELTSGLYFGPRRESGEDKAQPKAAWDTMIYHEEEVERVARVAFRIGAWSGAAAWPPSTRPTSWRRCDSGVAWSTAWPPTFPKSSTSTSWWMPPPCTSSHDHGTSTSCWQATSSATSSPTRPRSSPVPSACCRRRRWRR